MGMGLEPRPAGHPVVVEDEELSVVGVGECNL
jgi:hypothetical protein